MPSYSIKVNGLDRTVESSDPNQPLLYVLRGLASQPEVWLRAWAMRCLHGVDRSQSGAIMPRTHLRREGEDGHHA
jgi:hypothetical protein